MAVNIYFVFCVKDLWARTRGYHVLKQYTAHISTVEVNRFGKALGKDRFLSNRNLGEKSLFFNSNNSTNKMQQFHKFIT
jgi:hypothetical protein